MLRQRRRMELRSPMPDEPRHDDDAATSGPGRQRQGGASSAPEGRPPCGAAAEVGPVRPPWTEPVPVTRGRTRSPWQVTQLVTSPAAVRFKVQQTFDPGQRR